jgi:LPS O-antigen subunit length determinant protein (WzzB/FepE family)
MILVFLIILIAALIIANIMVSLLEPKKSEKAFINPLEPEEPEVIEQMNNLHENTALMRGSLNATNKKLDMLNERVNSLEKIVMTMVEEKITDHNKKQIEE